jgi:uncharacterized protein YjeT (DUF2065 family)
MLSYWLLALGLMLVLEGMMPFLFPLVWRETLHKLSRLQDGQVRFIGLTLMLVGVLVIYWVK